MGACVSSTDQGMGLTRMQAIRLQVACLWAAGRRDDAEPVNTAVDVCTVSGPDIDRVLDLMWSGARS